MLRHRGRVGSGRRLLAGAVLLLAGWGLALPAGAVPAAGPSARSATYRNPVSGSFADTFADPSIIQAKDGWWYAYATSDPLRAGDPEGGIHIARTRDFAHWSYLGTVFGTSAHPGDNRPAYATDAAHFWAPDIRYDGGRYVLYFTVTDTTLNDSDEDFAIGMATAPTPAGPWTAADAPVVAPRPGNGGFLATIDPAQFTDRHGRRYLYWGSYNGGLFATRLTADGTRAVGKVTRVAIDNRYEGSYVVRHHAWYYLMVSAANCCAGPTTGYAVFAGRSRSPLGPFRDADGISLLASRVGGTPMITQNGNRWIGPGHHALFTDAAGRTWAAYHALDRNDAWLDDPGGINKRPLLVDRVDWVHGWPRLRAGRGPSASRQDVPLSTSGLGITAANPTSALRGAAAGPKGPQSGATALVHGLASTKRAAAAGSVRVRLDVRSGRTGNPVLVTGLGNGAVRAVLRDHRLTLSTRHQTVSTHVAPGGDHWRTLTVQVRGHRVLAQVGESDLGDPAAEVRLRDPKLRLPSAPVRFFSARQVVDNLYVRRPAVDAARLAPVPQSGARIGGDDFASGLGSGWSWIRQDEAATVSGGALRWPVQDADLSGDGTPGVLLHDTPSGRWVAETKVHLDLGVDDVRNYQQAGLIVYRGDDDFARLDSVAIWNTRQTEFFRELVDTDDSLRDGGSLVGTPAATVYLRLAHTRNAAGEHLYRAGTSRDGRHWTWGATWTFAAGTAPRIGLVAQGGTGDDPAVTASFGYLRFYRLR